MMKRKPKIGDMVHYYSRYNKKHPAIIREIYNETEMICNLFVILHDYPGWNNMDIIEYSKDLHPDRWSWPEEEPKECEHDYRDICLIRMPPIYQKKCFYCGNVKEQEPQVNKADELIDKIHDLVKDYCDETPQYVCNIARLIKEYKSK